jgi:hypothetical protein
MLPWVSTSGPLMKGSNSTAKSPMLPSSPAPTADPAGAAVTPIAASGR